MPGEEYFRGKGCVITGAASGIGFALSEALLQAGAVVFMADIDTKTLASATKQLVSHAGRIHSTIVDVTKEDQVRRLVEESASRHGRLDLLFNNAGIGGTLPIGDVTLEHWRRIIDINIWSVVYGTQFALPIMRRQKGGHIVNTASIAGLIPIPYQALYCATKYAVAGFSESLRFELEEEGIHVSVICPGAVVSRIWATPLIGERMEGIRPPADAIPAEDAAQTILSGVANKEGIIALPASAKAGWRRYWSSPEETEAELRNMARQRRESYRAKGTFY